MAATIARATGYDKSRSKETQRLGSELASVEAATWRTFARARVARDGSGSVTVTRDGKTLLSVTFGPEGGPQTKHAPEGIYIETAAGWNLAGPRMLQDDELAAGPPASTHTDPFAFSATKES